MFVVIAWLLLFSLRLSFNKIIPLLSVKGRQRFSAFIMNSLPVKAVIFCVITIFFLSLVASSSQQGLTIEWIYPSFNFVNIIMFLAIWSEICDLNFSTRAKGIFRLGVFAYFVLPLLLWVMSKELAPLLTPWGYGVHAFDLYMGRAHVELHLGATVFHAFVLIGLFFVWTQSWAKILTKRNSATA